jgi:hypothetical protein
MDKGLHSAVVTRLRISAMQEDGASPELLARAHEGAREVVGCVKALEAENRRLGGENRVLRALLRRIRATASEMR